MGAHARSSWGAIDPEPRPPLSAVPRPTMAGAFYPKSAGPPFSQTTSATTSRPSKTTYNAQIYRLALLVGDSKAKEQFFLDSFSVIPVSGKNVQKKKSFARIPPLWSVELASDWNRPSRWLDRKSRAMTEIVVSVADLSLSLSVPKAGDGGKMRGREDQSRTWLGHAEMPPGMTTQENIR